MSRVVTTMQARERVHRQQTAERVSRRIDAILRQAGRLEVRHASILKHVHPAYRLSARNLLCYLALRHADYARLEGDLESFGTSLAGNTHRHMEASLQALRRLFMLQQQKTAEDSATELSMAEARRLSRAHRRDLFGSAREFSAGIMITLPDETIRDPDLVRTFVAGGMNIARINCAMGGPERWGAMIDSVRQASPRSRRRCRVLMDLSGSKLRTGPVARGVRDLKIRLKPGDELMIDREQIPGEPAVEDADGRCVRPAHISCTDPQALSRVRAGHAVSFDDGTIQGVVRSAGREGIRVIIRHVAGKRGRLGADKGINLPDTHPGVHGLTPRDRADLAFIAGRADIVSLSFARGPQEVRDLHSALGELEEARRLGVVIKIETRQAYEQLPAIVLEAMRYPRTGVLIARGDLAAECGWEGLASMQEEILTVAEASHMPVMIATQVLERLIKKGLPSRPEIIDAATAGRADCVMLNKGPHLPEALAMVRKIVRLRNTYAHSGGALLARCPFRFGGQ